MCARVKQSESEEDKVHDSVQCLMLLLMLMLLLLRHLLSLSLSLSLLPPSASLGSSSYFSATV